MKERKFKIAIETVGRAVKAPEWLTDNILNDERFGTWSGSSKSHQHHYGDHGLITHTAEVIQVIMDKEPMAHLLPPEVEWLGYCTWLTKLPLD